MNGFGLGPGGPGGTGRTGRTGGYAPTALAGPTAAGTLADPGAGRTDTAAGTGTLPALRGGSPAEGGGLVVPPDSSWKNWWTQPADRFELDDALGDLTARRSAGDPAPAEPADLGDSDDLGGSALARRTPQANLADELRRPADTAEASEASPGGARPERDPLQARSALSRFQATQRAARLGERPGPGTDGEAPP